MSRDGVFDGLEDMDLSNSELSYESGAADCDLKFVDTVIQYYIDQNEKHNIGMFNSEKEILRFIPILERGIKDDFHPNAFLDCLVIRLGQYWNELESSNLNRHGNIETFLNMIVQGLYCKDYNDFVLNLEALQHYFRPEDSDKGKNVASSLLASKDRPLRLKVIGNVNEFGYYARNCILELDGDANEAGEMGQNSRYILSGIVDEVAKKSEHCRFDIEHQAKISHGAKNTAIYAKNGVLRKGKSAWEFVWEKTNELWTPDTSGEWGRVDKEGKVIRQ